MFYSLTGKIVDVSPGFAAIECGGVAFEVNMPQNAVLPAQGSTATVYTHLNVSENAMSLFGFESLTDRQMFLLLTGVSGVGPKVGLAILSALSPERITLAISAGDHKAFTAAQGVGPKLAQRIVLELKDKMPKGISGGGIAMGDLGGAVQGAPQSAVQQAIEALTALGYTQSEAAAACIGLDGELPVAEMVRLALKSLGKW